MKSQQQQQQSNKPTPRATNTTTTKAVAKRQTRTSARIQSQQLMPTTSADKNLDMIQNTPSPPPTLSDTKLNPSNEKGTPTCHPNVLSYHSNIWVLDRPHHDMRMTHMWPFRYFGFHTDMQDILGKPMDSFLLLFVYY